MGRITLNPLRHLDVWGTDMILDECAKCGAKPWGRRFFEVCYKVITPIGMLIVLYGQIVSFFG